MCPPYTHPTRAKLTCSRCSQTSSRDERDRGHRPRLCAGGVLTDHQSHFWPLVTQTCGHTRVATTLPSPCARPTHIPHARNSHAAVARKRAHVTSVTRGTGPDYVPIHDLLTKCVRSRNFRSRNLFHSHFGALERLRRGAYN